MHIPEKWQNLKKDELDNFTHTGLDINICKPVKCGWISTVMCNAVTLDS